MGDGLYEHTPMHLKNGQSLQFSMSNKQHNQESLSQSFLTNGQQSHGLS